MCYIDSVFKLMKCSEGGDIRKAVSCGATFILAALLMLNLRYLERGGGSLQTNTNTSLCKYDSQKNIII